ncbi:hypothetical protein EDD37DRAFT_162448 [Exophiala viscosa]|uniref:Uncharacterized protein n=1 Tax=Exophiala viscosa TaxID=2486360 RepID=A0AAN6DMU9_9EURO|nr:hypothetical protein EDD36DRAFT_68542 [Exophiala viscosa]KAI1620622.1 hypothetical protein EDD37DRAFT_162448 [Exophiala viscosa]
MYSALPILTTLIGLGGLIVGVYSFIAPVSAAQIYGVQPPRVSVKSKKTDDVTSDAENVSRHLAYSGIRNLVVGLTVLTLTWYWQYGAHSTSDKVTVQRCLGIVITTGWLTPVVDAVVTWRGAGQGVDAAIGERAALLHAARSVFWLAGGLWCLLG